MSDAPVAGAPNAENTDGTIRVYLMSSAETGFADFVRLPAGATIQTLWQQQMGTSDPSKFVIRINRENGEAPTGRLPADFVLMEGDRITITPHKVQGA
jgi:hypothetical protein